MRELSLYAACIFALYLLAATGAWAAAIETLLMPGELIEGHAEYEQECTNCHERFSKSTQNRLCLDCHEEVAKDVKARTGYHGRTDKIRDVKCKTCHTDHIGRDANVVPLDQDRFNHRATDFPLKGAHLKVRCDACHDTDKLYREAPGRCVGCHEKHDSHQGRLGDDCQECHQAKAWLRTDFDHAVTEFPLRDKHDELACSSCHPNDRFEGTPLDCYSCHALNDTHGGDYGKRCETCHTPKEWESSIFNHDRDTEFALKHGHRDVRCGACHEGELYDQDRDDACFSCHENDDAHRSRYGEGCDKCHSSRGWTSTNYDHAEESDFALLGKHGDLQCRSCHKGRIDEDELKTECYACHRNDDVHAGQEGEQCDACHDEEGWGNRVAFEHDLTRFPLIGQHSAAPCEECHLSTAFKDAPLDCRSCHEGDDEHKRRLGRECAQCHNPNGWSLWQFDHETRTDFALDGAHEDLQCHACHTKPGDRDKPVASSGQCSSCHWQDDTHDGRFGLNCDRCHTTEAFKPATLLLR